MSSGAAANEDRRQRIRDQMRAFYGNPDDSAKRSVSQQNTQGSSSLPPELDLDSDAFNVNKYTTDLLKRESLKGLVETDTDLLRRVRRLDGELQELVYRNYARFISATDTIREMKDNVVEMDAKLQALSANVQTIDSISSLVSQQLQVHRSQIEDTITANRMLKKVRFLTTLPTTLNRLVEKKEFNVAVKYWIAGDRFLVKHRSIPSLAQVHDECRATAGELYRCIEAAMCAYPLDEPDAMDRINSYVEDMRLLRATAVSESGGAARTSSFEEAVRRALMKSVSSGFEASMATAQRSIKAALAVPSDLSAMDVARREQSLEQVNLREPLAQLKNACAMLAVNSAKVYALLDSGRRDDAAAEQFVAKDVSDALLRLLTPTAESLAIFAIEHVDAICLDAAAVEGNTEQMAKVLQAAAASVARLLKQLLSAFKTLGEIYVDEAEEATTASLSAKGRSSSGGGVNERVTAPPAYAAQVNEAISAVLVQLCDTLHSRVLRVPDAAAMQACQSTGVANTSILTASPANADAANAAELNFIWTFFSYASMAALLHEAVTSALSTAEGLPVRTLTKLSTGMSDAAVQLCHRGIILLGQMEVEAVYRGAFCGGSEHPDAVAAAAVPTVPVELVRLVAEWSRVYNVMKILPPAIPIVSQSVTKSADSRTTSLSRPRDVYGGYRGGRRPVGGGGGTNSSTGTYSDHRGMGGGDGSLQHRSRQKLTVSYTRQATSALQMSVEHIFAHTDAVLRTLPGAGGGTPGALMACIVRYVLQSIVDLVRDEGEYSVAEFHRLQVGCTFLLQSLLAPRRGTAQRSWRSDWTEADAKDVQRLLNEICTGAYDLYEAKVPLSVAVLDKAVEDALRGGSSSSPPPEPPGDAKIRTTQPAPSPPYSPAMAATTTTPAAGPSTTATTITTQPTTTTTKNTAAAATSPAPSSTAKLESQRPAMSPPVSSDVSPTAVSVRPICSTSTTTAASKSATAPPRVASEVSPPVPKPPTAVYRGASETMNRDYDEELPI